MSRIRTIKPEFWTSDQIVACSYPARLLFIGIWNFCDDSGICPATPKRLKMQIFPGDDIGIDLLCQWIDELKAQKLLTEYKINDRRFYQVTGWHHQRIEKPTFRFPKEDGCIPQAIKPPIRRRTTHQRPCTNIAASGVAL
ncbi:MAG: hypothetical protein HQL76_08785 [Magnetococcales bacterium]|nr:hypothetical protein [Magnetococcales bacterium]